MTQKKTFAPKKKLQLDTRPDDHPDPNMHPHYWFNKDPRQNHYFRSILSKIYPGIKELFNDTLTCPPGKVLHLQHRYYHVYTRDDSRLSGAWLTSDMLEAFPPAMFTRGGALGHENG